METLGHSLELAGLITGAITLFLCLAVIPRLHTIWKARRGVSLSMPFQDVEELRFRVSEALKSIGTLTPSSANGSFAIEPSKWRKRAGVRPVTVDLIDPHLALVSSQGPILNGLAKNQKLPLVKDPNNTFGIFLKKQGKWFGWTMGCVFVVIFVLAMVNDSQSSSRSKAKIVPVEQPYSAEGSR